ncbi:MAG: hypothetical protein A3J52_03500 [Omnitrophica bacterium RIFCSPHIGHO2_02_FULL_49_9]|nr:MAG: hypothetical protein A3J52_03500 [Omnitrophica bacterium RIFCSPHIGHO2_02_FULL_49_9]OGW89482.1 MAG: hypothetical protein A3A73_05375 [Omnitrophica bacterium RIFCSPLOWO2_01_FULL_50_24]
MNGHKKKLLIVEDDDAIARLLSMFLREQKFEVSVAQDGEAALQEAKSTTPDLIILDLILPSLSGEEICKAIREDDDEEVARIPIVVLTAKSADVDRIVCKVTGANSYVTKPFDRQGLLEEIRKWI